MTASLTVAITHNLIWLIWAFANRFQNPTSSKMTVAILTLFATALFEVFDFAPYMKVIDAHSLFHLSTIPCVALYWEFLLLDSKWQIRDLKLS